MKRLKGLTIAAGLFVLLGIGIWWLHFEFSLRQSLLQGIGLPVTPELLIKAKSLMRPPAVSDILEAPAQTDFAPGVPYEKLLSNGKIRLSIYREQIQKLENWTAETERLQKRAAKSGVLLHLMGQARQLKKYPEETKFPKTLFRQVPSSRL